MTLSAEQHVIYPDARVAELPRVAERQSAYAASGMTAPSVRSIGLTNVGTPDLTVEIRDVAQRRLVGRTNRRALTGTGSPTPRRLFHEPPHSE